MVKLESEEEFDIVEVREDEEEIKETISNDKIYDLASQTRKYWISDYALSRVMANQNFILLTTGGTGCQPAGSKVLMADRMWKNVENVKVGDLVLSPQEDGTYIYAPVLKTYEWFSEKNYNIIDKGNNKTLYTCSYNHKMPLYYKHKSWLIGKFRAEQLVEQYTTIKTLNGKSLKIEDAEPSIVYGFTLNSPSSLYITNNWIITHNSGKSFNSMSIGLDLDSNFDIDRVVFTPEEFIKVVKSGLPPGSVILWDEAGVGLSSREWYSLQNKMISYVLETFRRDNLILIMTTPNMSYIDKKVRTLFHGYAETIDPTFTGGLFGWVKYFHIVVDIRRGAILYMYPRIRDKHGRTKILRGATSLSGNMQFNKPPDWLIEPYEVKKLQFTESLKDSALAQMTAHKSGKFKLEIRDIIEMIGEHPQRYGLLNEDLTKTDIIDKAWVMLSLENPGPKINKSLVSSAINYLIQVEDYKVKGRMNALSDDDIETIKRLLGIHKKKTTVAKALGISIPTLHKNIASWKKRGMWNDDQEGDEKGNEGNS